MLHSALFYTNPRKHPFFLDCPQHVNYQHNSATFQSTSIVMPIWHSQNSTLFYTNPRKYTFVPVSSLVGLFIVLCCNPYTPYHFIAHLAIFGFVEQIVLKTTTKYPNVPLYFYGVLRIFIFATIRFLVILMEHNA